MRVLFLDIPGFPGYRAGSDGHIYSYKVRTKIDFSLVPKRLKAHPYSTGKYLFVVLRRNGKSFPKSVHRLVCEAFTGPCPKGFDCSHLNGNDMDNRPENLIWETRKQNISRKVVHGTDDCGHKNSRALFDQKQISNIRRLLSLGATAREIAVKFNCNERTIGKIKRGEHYART